MPVRVNFLAEPGRVQSRPGGWLRFASEVESMGYDTLHVGDHLVPGGGGPFTAMASAAAVTERLRVGTAVMTNDFRHPVVVAHEVAALADLSAGRVTLGLGPGSVHYEFAQAGIAFDPPGRRVARLGESAAIIRRLLAGDTVDADGEYELDQVAVRGRDAPPVALLIGGNGTRVLQTAGRLADIVGITGFTPSADGAGREPTHVTEVGLAERLTVVRAAAGDRWPLDVDLLVRTVVVTDRPEVAIDRLAARMHLPPEVVRTSPFVLVGSAAEIAERLGDLHERFGVTSVTVAADRPGSDQDERTMAPVIELLG
ncbi:MAG: fgd1 5 [Ilumatobacteraceae bacterium]|nr:fgd1 5 [Ilumatobacteraceae bacterium]